MSNAKVYFAKLKDDVKIPTKRSEDAGFDIYANFDVDYMIIKPHETVKIPTRLCGATDPEHFMMLKERGSNGVLGIAQRSGIMDSGYRGEWFVPLTNTGDTPVMIVKPELRTMGGFLPLAKAICRTAPIIYPYEKAICQAIVLDNILCEVIVMPVDEFKALPSERGEGALGSSGK